MLNYKFIKINYNMKKNFKKQKNGGVNAQKMIYNY